MFTNFIMGALPYWMIIPGKTLQDMHTAITWGFEWGLEGRFATHDHLKRPITPAHGKRRYERRGKLLTQQGHRMACSAMKMDLQYEKVTFKFHTYDEVSCCKNCKVVKRPPGVLLTEIGPDAGWRPDMRTNEEYLAEIGAGRDDLTKIPGWHLGLHRGDPMHLIFLGFGLLVLGSCIMCLARVGRWRGASLSDKLLEAWHEMRSWMRAHGLTCSQTKYKQNSFTMQRLTDYPELKAKAHNCRVQLSWIAEICREHADPNNEELFLMATATWALADVLWVADSYFDWQLPVDLAERQYEHGQIFLACCWLVQTVLCAFVWALPCLCALVCVRCCDFHDVVACVVLLLFLLCYRCCYCC